MRESERVPVFHFEKLPSLGRYHNFIYYISKLDRATASDYDLDYLGPKFLKAEEL